MSAFYMGVDDISKIANWIFDEGLEEQFQGKTETKEDLYLKLAHLNQYTLIQRYGFSYLVYIDKFKENLKFEGGAKSTIESYNYQCSEGNTIKLDLYKEMDKLEKRME